MDLIAIALGGFLLLGGVLMALLGRDMVLLSRRNRHAFAQAMAATVVAYLEQASFWDDSLLENTARKERAILELTQWSGANRVKLTFKEMDMLIEEAVLLLPYGIDHDTPDLGWTTVVGAPTDRVDYGNVSSGHEA